MDTLRFVSPEYQEQLVSLARTLTERFRSEVEVVNPLSIPRDELDDWEYQANRWESCGEYLVREV